MQCIMLFSSSADCHVSTPSPLNYGPCQPALVTQGRQSPQWKSDRFRPSVPALGLVSFLDYYYYYFLTLGRYIPGGV